MIQQQQLALVQESIRRDGSCRVTRSRDSRATVFWERVCLRELHSG